MTQMDERVVGCVPGGPPQAATHAAGCGQHVRSPSGINVSSAARRHWWLCETCCVLANAASRPVPWPVPPRPTVGACLERTRFLSWMEAPHM